ncbi:MAG: hypothetical protein KDD37_11900, partial [Bdellovibrionales bacterium]|nr:hypothetical protein [Bdellovibrionales bacterium]
QHMEVLKPGESESEITAMDGRKKFLAGNKLGSKGQGLTNPESESAGCTDTQAHRTPPFF